MTTPTSYLLPILPEGLESLAELALDLSWSWNYTVEALWRRIATPRHPWEASGTSGMKVLVSRGYGSVARRLWLLDARALPPPCVA
jgi:hypothetical protein